MNIYLVIDNTIAWGEDAVWKAFSSRKKAEKFISGFPKSELVGIIIQKFKVNDCNNE